MAARIAASSSATPRASGAIGLVLACSIHLSSLAIVLVRIMACNRFTKFRASEGGHASLDGSNDYRVGLGKVIASKTY